MTTTRQRLIDLLAMGRVANLPTVVSNVVLGFGLGTFTITWAWVGDEIRITYLGLAVASGILLYLGGCFLNDWKDATWDEQHRPERALPQGRIKANLVAIIAGVFLLLGAGLAGLINSRCLITATAIIAAIVLYTTIHKSTRWAVVPMGLCRALLYPLGFLAALEPKMTAPSDLNFYSDAHTHDVHVSFLFGLINFPTTWERVDLINGTVIVSLTALGMFSYIVAVSLIARCESKGVLHRSYLIVGMGLILVAACLHSLSWFPHYRIPAALSLAPLAGIAAVASLQASKNVGRTVSLLLAGIALLDLVAAAPMAAALYPDQPGSALAWGITPIAAFFLALLLQRIAPAT